MAISTGGTGDEVNAEINVTPMIDVMLVLLIIFMIVTPLVSAGFSAQMPEGRNRERAAEDSGDIVLGISQQGRYYLDPGDGKISPVVSEDAMQSQLDVLESMLTRLYSNRTKDKILFFKADAGIEFGEIEEALEVARRSGVRVLAAVTVRPRRESER